MGDTCTWSHFKRGAQGPRWLPLGKPRTVWASEELKTAMGYQILENCNPLIQADPKWMRGKKGLLLGGRMARAAWSVYRVCWGWQAAIYCHPVKDQPRQESSMVAKWKWKFWWGTGNWQGLTVPTQRLLIHCQGKNNHCPMEKSDHTLTGWWPFMLPVSGRWTFVGFQIWYPAKDPASRWCSGQELITWI